MLNEHVHDFIHLHSTLLCRIVCKGRRQAVHLIIEKECLLFQRKVNCFKTCPCGHLWGHWHSI